MILDSNDMHHAFSSKQNTVDKPVRPDVNSMPFQIETAIDFPVWIRGTLNPADVGTKKDNSLTETLLLTLEKVVLQIYLTDCEVTRRNKSYV